MADTVEQVRHTHAQRLEAMIEQQKDWWQNEILGGQSALDPVRRLDAAFDRFVWSIGIHNETRVLSVASMTSVYRIVAGADALDLVSSVTSAFGDVAELSMAADLWSLARGELDMDVFIECHGFHGEIEGNPAGRSWREVPSRTAQPFRARARAPLPVHRRRHRDHADPAHGGAATRAGAQWTLAYRSRTRGSMAFVGELANYGDRVAIHPQDHSGLLDLDSLLADPDEDTLIYCCGPGSLLDAVEQSCSAWPRGALHVERFTPTQQNAPVRSDSFEVELATTGKILTVPPDRSILDVIEDAGLQLLSSCREGTCETRVLTGTIDHRDSLLTDQEKSADDTMLICASRAACPWLVLDL